MAYEGLASFTVRVSNAGGVCQLASGVGAQHDYDALGKFREYISCLSCLGNTGVGPEKLQKKSFVVDSAASDATKALPKDQGKVLGEPAAK
jgi:hypothetical protein